VARPEEYPHSSYRSYIRKEKEDIVHRDLILEMISQRRKEGPKSYKEYVERAIGEEYESPFKNIYAGVILGSRSFIKQTLERLTGELFDREHIAHKGTNGDVVK